MPNNKDAARNSAFCLSCECKLHDLDISVGVVRCAHGRTLFAPGFGDFVQERRSKAEEQIDAEVNSLCDGIAADVLADDLDAEDGLFDFAVEVLRTNLRSEKNVNHKEIEKELADLVGAFEAEDAAAAARTKAAGKAEQRAGEFVGTFLGDLCSLPIVLRSNGRKAGLYHELLAALEELAASDDDGDQVQPWEGFAARLARADFALFDRDQEGFGKIVIESFQKAARHPDFSFVTLENAIRHEQDIAEIQRLRRKAGLRALGIR